MQIKPDYIIHADQSHYGWNRSIPPVVKVNPGSVVEVETVDASGGQIRADSTLEHVKNLDFEKVNPVTGPVYIEGAEAGDVLKVTILSFKPSGWGWSAVIPGLACWQINSRSRRFISGNMTPKPLRPLRILKEPGYR